MADKDKPEFEADTDPIKKPSDTEVDGIENAPDAVEDAKDAIEDAVVLTDEDELDSEVSEAGDESDSASDDTEESESDDQDDAEPDETPESESDESETIDAAEEILDLPDPEPAPAPAAPVPEPAKRGGFGAAFFGGVVAAGLGFVAGNTGLLDSVLPGGADDGAAVQALNEQLASQGAELAELKSAIGAIALPDVSGLESGLSGVTGKVDGLSGELAALVSAMADLKGAVTPLDQRLTELEKRPVAEGMSEAAVAAYERELEAMKEAVVTQRQEMEAMIAETRAMEAAARELEAKAAADTQRSANRATITRIRSELDTGAPFSGLLAELQTGGVEVPAALAAVADNGAVTMAALRDTFPEAARDALSAARAGSAEGDRSITGFLQRQLGARSVQPRDGDDPDAVLSRAEAALITGDLTAALTEIKALPAPAQEHLNDWVGLAALRVAAIEAVNSLAQDQNN